MVIVRMPMRAFSDIVLYYCHNSLLDAFLNRYNISDPSVQAGGQFTQKPRQHAPSLGSRSAAMFSSSILFSELVDF
jgi:hypothetical protein